MRREKIERLKEIFDDAWYIMRSEWDFAHFKEQNDKTEKEANDLFDELFREAE